MWGAWKVLLPFIEESSVRSRFLNEPIFPCAFTGFIERFAAVSAANPIYY